ncbi:MAG: type II secretion system protein GspD [Gammaproteobacteria bacterium HGW-Gammaproteobacteria-2]|jgi:general secretion pathway protein D|nr:MAG: type II secretion system protein GspD [Gammaproteobacteria bacterium HGW-Gammaproteobacteria-2]
MKRSSPRLQVVLLAVLVTVLAGCASDDTRPVIQHRDDLNYRTSTQTAAADAATAKPAAVDGRTPGTVFMPGSGELINEQLAAEPRPAIPPVGEATFNFEGESVLAVVKAILGDLLQQNYVIAPEVQGTVTLSTPRPVNADQALSLLEMALSWNNASMVWSNGRYNIVPSSKAVAGNLAPRVGTGKGSRGFEVRAVPLKFIAALEMEKLLKPFAREGSVLNVDPGRNMIVVSGTSSELDNYLRTIQIFDVDWLAGMSVGIFPLRAQEASKVVDQLNQVFGEKGGSPLTGMLRFMPLEGINAVMVITHQPKYLADAEQWIQRIDLGGEGSSLFVYEVQYAKATDLADQLNQVFGSGGATRNSRGAADPFNISPGLDPVRVRTLENGAPSSPPAPAASSSGNAISLGNTENVFISAVEDNNALLVRASAGQWDSIRRAIERLDQMPLQVHVEAQVVEVKLNKSLEYGVSWFFGNQVPSANLALSQSLNNFDNVGSLISRAANTFTFVGPSAQAVVDLLDTVTDVTVLSAPSVLVRNNVEATFNSGQQIPVVSTILNPVLGGGDGNNSNLNASQVQFRQTGIVLTVKPRANADGSVFMEVSQSVSSPSNRDLIGGNVSVDTNDVQTEVLVRDGETVIIAGLISTTNDRGSSGLPFLSRIPVIGALFGSQTSSANRSELVVLITPTIIRASKDLSKLTEEYGRRFRGLDPLPTSPQAEGEGNNK